MGFLDKVKRNLKKIKQGVIVDIQNEDLKQKVEFVLYNLPKELIKGIEIVEEVYDVEAEENRIIIKNSMDPIDIKRQIGKFVFRNKRWDKQEETTQKLLAKELIDLSTFYDAYDTTNYLSVYEIINADVFSVYYGNPSMDLDEISIAINSLYSKNAAERSHSEALESFIDELFNQ